LWWLATKRCAGDKRRAFAWALACVCVLALARDAFIFYQQTRLLPNRLATKNYRETLAQTPPDAVLIAGGQTVAVNYWRNLGLGRWEAIGTGGGWPGDALIPLIEQHLANGRRVFLDPRPQAWAVCGWQAQETRQIAGLEQRFRFRLSGNLYEICRFDQGECKDSPNLSALLPEHRPADLKLCFNVAN
jgi:hypothetical protein